MQKMKRMLSRLFGGGGGYYLALMLCVAAVGVSGWLFYRSLAGQDEPASADAQVGMQLAQLPELAAPALPTENALPAAVAETQPETETPTRPAPTPQPLTTVAPVDGSVLAPYCVETLAYNETMRDWRTHAGIDLAAAEGSAVCAAADGTVEAVAQDDFLGCCVTVRHADGYVTHYANLAEEVSVKIGDTVKAGDQLGSVGKTALLEIGSEPHLHFSVTRYNVPVDPAEFLP